MIARRNTIAVLALAFCLLPFLPFARREGSDVQWLWSEARRAFEGFRARHYLLAEVCPAYQLHAHEHVRLDGTFWSVGEPDTEAKVFRENLPHLLLVGLDHAFPQERLVLKVS